MIALLIILVVALGAALAALATVHLNSRPRRRTAPASVTQRILFPFLPDALSPRALDGALRLANAEDAVLVPMFLARVPLHLPLDTPLPGECGLAIPLQEAIEQRAAAFHVPVDARIERGRTPRHGLRRAIATTPFDRIVIAASTRGGHGFDVEDIAWLLAHAPGEIVVLRPGEAEVALPGPRRRARRRSIVNPERQRRHDDAAVRL